MKRPAALLPLLQKRILYISTAFLWVSGLFWLYCKYFGQIQGEFGQQASPIQPVMLEIPGAAAMIFLMIFGTLLLYHVPTGWEQKRQRPSGGFLLGICWILILTGWGLYYVGNETLRHWTSLIHIFVGVALPLLIYIHIQLGRRSE
jgi:hypothetical protein